MIRKFDFLIIGSGVAGMSYALQVAASGKGKVALVCKTTMEEANTTKAQGGVASVTNLEVDNFDKHIRDTIIAGDYISDPAAVRQVVTGAPEGIKNLLKWGVRFDKNEQGEFDLHREGGHSEFRILHHADDTGFEIQRGLMEAVRATPNITVLENHFAVEIITQHHLGVEVTRRTPDIECYGAYILDPDTKKIDTFLSRVTVLATGGCGAVYAATTNPNIATGDGIAMAYRAKATVQDMEFIQFHPTALYHPGETHPAYLITEAMRGYGGILRLPNGEEFMQKYDRRLSLAPRDIVARAIDKEMKIHGLDHVCLDVTHKDPEETKHHFPNIYAKCLSIGIDITKEYIPVMPCAHYLCGGIKVNLDGCSSIRRLYAIGECSCTGLHGGNRLASNSLIEAVVYAEAAARHSVAHIDEYAFKICFQHGRARMERRGHNDERGKGAHRTGRARGGADHVVLRGHRAQQPAPAPRLDAPRPVVRGDGGTLQAREGHEGHLRAAQHDKRGLPHHAAGPRAQGEPRTALHARLSQACLRPELTTNALYETSLSAGPAARGGSCPAGCRTAA